MNNELGALSNKNNTLRSKIAAMDAEQPPVPVIEERNKLLENDVVKLNEFLTMINDKIKKREDASVRMQQELAAFSKFALFFKKKKNLTGIIFFKQTRWLRTRRLHWILRTRSRVNPSALPRHTSCALTRLPSRTP